MFFSYWLRVAIPVLAGACLFCVSCGQRTEEPPLSSDSAPVSQPASVEDATPVIGAITPAIGQGATASLKVAVSHPGGAEMIKDVQVLINEVLPGPGQTACWIDVNAGKTLAAKKEDGSGFFDSVPVGSPKTVSNSKCSVRAAEVRVEPSGQELSITLPISFAAGFKGPKRIWVIASGPTRHSGWQQRGSWLVE